MIIPQLISSAAQLINLLKNYNYSQVFDWLSNTFNIEGDVFSSLESSLGDISKTLITLIQDFIPSLMNATVSIANNIINFLTGLIIA